MMGLTYVAIDLETTGLDSRSDRILELAAVRYTDGREVDNFSTLVQTDVDIPLRIQRLTGITAAMLEDAPPLNVALESFLDFCHSSLIIGYNVEFDLGFINEQLRLIGGSSQPLAGYDCLELARLALPILSDHRLATVSEVLGLEGGVHRALSDARVCGQSFERLLQQLGRLPRYALQEITDIMRHTGWPLQEVAERLMSNAPEATQQRVAEVINKEIADPAEYYSPIDGEEVAQLLGGQSRLASCLSGYEARPQQVQMLHLVTEAFNEGRILMVEAGTGTGKSLAYLLPAARWALAQGSRVVISTHTLNLQQQLIEKDIPLLREALGEDISALVIKGRRHYLCMRKWNDLRRSTPQLLDRQEAQWQAQLVSWLSLTTTGDLSELNQHVGEKQWWWQIGADAEACAANYCQHREQCFVTALRRKAQGCHLLVVNHSLIMSDLSTQNRVLPRYDHVIFDEAQHLDAVAGEHLSAHSSREAFNRVYEHLGDVRRGALNRLLSALRKEGLEDDLLFDSVRQASQRMLEAATAVFGQFGQWLSQHGRADEGYARSLRLELDDAMGSEAFANCSSRIDSLAQVVHQLDDSIQALRDLALGLGHAGQEALLDVLRWAREARDLLNPLLRLRNGNQENTVFWLEEGRRSGDITLVAAPLWVDQILHDELFTRLRTTVLTSATLTIDGSFAHSSRRLGLDRLSSPELMTEAIDSPFNYAEQVLLAVPTGLPVPRGRNTKTFEEALHQFLARLFVVTGGRTLVLFTSHRMLRQAHAYLEGPMAAQDICVLAQGVNGSRNRLLEEFRTTDRTVLLGTSSFWEGVDVPGKMLSCVVLVKLPFSPPTTPLLAARMDQLRQQGGSPFADLALPEAIMRVKQGFGRLIRSASDRGVVLILDSRVLEEGSNYGSKFINSLPGPRLFSDGPEVVLEAVEEWLGQE